MTPSDGESDGLVALSKAARLARLKPEIARRMLRQIQRRTGDQLLWKFSDAPNAKIWTTPAAVKRLVQETAGEATDLDLYELRSRDEQHETRLDRLERRLDAIARRFKPQK